MSRNKLPPCGIFGSHPNPIQTTVADTYVLIYVFRKYSLSAYEVSKSTMPMALWIDIQTEETNSGQDRLSNGCLPFQLLGDLALGGPAGGPKPGREKIVLISPSLLPEQRPCSFQATFDIQLCFLGTDVRPLLLAASSLRPVLALTWD